MLEEVLGENSHPPSGESSARQTPQPSSAATASQNQVKEVQATFAKQVMQVSYIKIVSVHFILYLYSNYASFFANEYVIITK